MKHKKVIDTVSLALDKKYRKVLFITGKEFILITRVIHLHQRILDY